MPDQRNYIYKAAIAWFRDMQHDDGARGVANMLDHAISFDPSLRRAAAISAVIWLDEFLCGNDDPMLQGVVTMRDELMAESWRTNRRTG